MMSASGIDDDVSRFFVAHISSIEQLEVLLLFRATAGREWSAEECSRELRSDVHWVQERLTELTAGGLLVARELDAVSRYHYAPSSEALQRLVEAAASAYRERRVSVINLIYGKLESDVQSFASAFSFSRKKGG